MSNSQYHTEKKTIQTLSEKVLYYIVTEKSEPLSKNWSGEVHLEGAGV